MNTLVQISKLFSRKIVVGAQKNLLIETVLLSTQNIFYS